MSSRSSGCHGSRRDHSPSQGSATGHVTVAGHGIGALSPLTVPGHGIQVGALGGGGGGVYQFKALCFRLSTTPQVFTQVFAAVSAWAHSHRICLLRYLDDWLVLASLESEAKKNI